MVQVLISESDIISSVHELQDTEDLGWIILITDRHGKVSTRDLLILVRDRTVKVVVDELGIKVQVCLLNLFLLVNLALTVFLNVFCQARPYYWILEITLD